MTTTEKLKNLKEILATCFINTNEKSISHGIEYKYTSMKETHDDTDFWVVSIIVKELAYGERTIQEFRYPKPSGIDIKNMEYHVLLDLLCSLTHGALTTWHEVSKMLATDTELQKSIIDESKEDNISSY